ncbi:DsbA family oxidoreductase [Streptomyces marianii]|uniref:DsbA family oxidoreductase n=1 Tax=Streptomyces marianii TaxID=1817406 RepID=A0A5R9E3X3_9ACTN|nr:DsbA family oxidoreductase [Streptomyces marianii]TLQ43632.1 DsbA family oxidoreductase [Streptomyces marianii]
MKVEIYSDLVCPWCYIGKRRFEKALAAFPGAAGVDVVYRPFQLDPAASETAEPSADVYERKFGRPAATMFGPLTRAAAAEGITFRMAEALAANTLQAHRLLWFARQHGRQAEVKERLLAHYFTDGGDLGDREALAGLAEAAGLDRAAALAFLTSSEGTGEVRAELAEAAALGVTAVPTFVIDGTLVLEGAQSPEVLLEALERAAADGSAATVS